MTDSADPRALYAIADQFIDQANQLAQQDASGHVGTGLRYAAARYSSFEASRMSNDLAADRERLLELFTTEFRKMMETNLDDYIRHLSAKPG